MVVKSKKPYTPSRRYMVGNDYTALTTNKPEKSLTKGMKRHAGRNNQGRVTSRFRGGGHKRKYRIVDTRRYDKLNIPARVVSIEYDPNRTSWIALVSYADGEKRYIIAWKDIIVGDQIMCGSDAPIKSGNRKQLKDIPEGLTVYNLEVTPHTKGKLMRSAGTFATISGKDEAEGLVFIKMPSGEVRKFHDTCRATMGTVSNEDHKLTVGGKAGKTRRMGRKGRLIGLNANPVDHPHGGGESHKGQGRKHRKMFSGKVVDPGMKTRRKRKRSDKFIVTRRKSKKMK